MCNSIILTIANENFINSINFDSDVEICSLWESKSHHFDVFNVNINNNNIICLRICNRKLRKSSGSHMGNGTICAILIE